jgi:hypothetical protein
MHLQELSHAANGDAATLGRMVRWIEIVALYLLGMGLMAWLGGISAAADAISQWGRSHAERRRCEASSCA